MDNPITYEQAEAIYDSAMEAAQDVPDGNPEASKAEAVAQIKYRVGELLTTLSAAPKKKSCRWERVGFSYYPRCYRDRDSQMTEGFARMFRYCPHCGGRIELC